MVESFRLVFLPFFFSICQKLLPVRDKRTTAAMVPPIQPNLVKVATITPALKPPLKWPEKHTRSECQREKLLLCLSVRGEKFAGKFPGGN
jgi:hypothetical protein